ncbi:tetratricopeptide repeat protein [Saccharothrix syringae]|uniref:Tetratricopeptide repeat protein n=1 Tax=Saccharothrix syringae TaxID=103733 RepID=A0A5Q0H0H6_SACSY|nr:tetratricopeptide repeat protein [Saccharothrix syringae]QFZ19425.1 hypothetical protein EKG83_20045 [Saccharothrix syringae]
MTIPEPRRDPDEVGNELAATSVENAFQIGVVHGDVRVSGSAGRGAPRERPAPRRPPNPVRVAETRPRLLGVHAAIRVPEDQEPDELPAYVPRDLDGALRAALGAAARRGGFVLLVGGSSVGKTRSLHEAVKAVVPDWWLVRPHDADAVRDFAANPAPRTVVWLDELQRYLDHPGGVPAGVLRDVVTAGALVVATLWPDQYGKRTAPAAPGRHPDRYDNDRELLGMAEVVAVPDGFSPAERRRAEALAADRRVRLALDTSDAGFTQVLAAGPHLVHHWEQAPEDQCCGRAVITAALDARRVGTRAPLTREHLAAACPGYLTPAQQATAPADWLDRALAYATAPLHGATSALVPLPAGMGRVAGYEVADYLHQHATRVRRGTHLPDTAWRALVEHHHADDARALADNAERRGRHAEAEAVHRRALDRAGDDPGPARRLADFLVGRDRVDEAVAVLGPYANADVDVALELAHLLTRRSRAQAVAVLRPHAREHPRAAWPLAHLLRETGRVDEAVAALRPHGDTDAPTLERTAGLLARWGRVDEAVAALRPRARTDVEVAWRLAPLLVRLGRPDEAVAALRPHARRGRTAVGDLLADLLVQRGRVDELTRRADDGESSAAERLARLLHERERVGELTRRADGGDDSAAYWLSRLLVRRGDVGELTRRADGGDSAAADGLAHLLISRGRTDELARRAAAGDRYAAYPLARRLAEEGRVEQAIAVLRPFAPGPATGTRRLRAPVVDLLVDLLAGHGHVDEALALLRPRAAAGHGRAAHRLVELLAGHGRVDEAVPLLRARADAGSRQAADHLVDLLRRHHRTDELDAEVAAGTHGAVAALHAATGN